MPRRSNTKEFIEKCLNFGLIEFDYSKVNYINNSTKVSIGCPKHGFFEITPNEFLSKNQKIKCPTCRNEIRFQKYGHFKLKYTEKEYLDKIHKNLKNENINLDLSDLRHSYATEKIKIHCNIHGDFYIAANSFVEYCDCKYCKKERTKKELNLKKMNVFLEKAKKKYPNIDYSIIKPCEKEKTEQYDIICPEHGKVRVFSDTFLKKGCPFCDDPNVKYRHTRRDYTQEQFLYEIKKVYGDKFDTSNTVYKNWNTKVKLVCPKHGEFLREPWRLIKEHRGCPKCNESLIEKDLMKYLDEIKLKYVYQYRNKEILGLKTLDFFLPDYNIAIECHGRQHFFENSIFNIQNLTREEIINHDKEKYNMCLEKNLKVFYFSYYKCEDYFTKVYNSKDELIRDIINYSINERLL